MTSLSAVEHHLAGSTRLGRSERPAKGGHFVSPRSLGRTMPIPSQLFSRELGSYNPATAFPVVLARCTVEPRMTVAENRFLQLYVNWSFAFFFRSARQGLPSTLEKIFNGPTGEPDLPLKPDVRDDPLSNKLIHTRLGDSQAYSHVVDSYQRFWTLHVHLQTPGVPHESPTRGFAFRDSIVSFSCAYNSPDWMTLRD